MAGKILVGCPIFKGKEYCLKEFLDGLNSISYHDFDVCLVDNSQGTDFFKRLKQIAGEWSKTHKNKFFVERVEIDSIEPRAKIVAARNVLLEKTLKGGYDYFFSLEADVVAPSDVLERLICRGKKIISGIYFNLIPAKNSLVILAYKHLGFDEKGEEQTQTLALQKIMPIRVIENLRAVGVGCMLIHRSVLEKITFRFDQKFEAFDDWWFCTDAIKAGYSISVDTSMLCRHYYRPWL
mgnify:FL=1